MCLALTKKGTLCKNKNCTLHEKENNYILYNARELLYLTVGSSWTSQKKYIDGYMQLSLWLLTQEPTSYIYNK
jgi:hypothetical protein